MRVTFTISKQDSWNYHKYEKWRILLRYPIAFLGAYITGFILVSLVWAALVDLFARDIVFSLAVGGVAGSSGMMWYGFSARQRHYKELVSKPQWIGNRFAEVGKYDLCWGYSEETARYYHWCYVSSIAETSSYFYVTLKGKNVFIIPKAALPSSADAEDFGAEMLVRWEAAKQKQRYQEQEVDGTWPPAPRLGA